jgi:transcriptional regulator with XRE-family HTH domain
MEYVCVEQVRGLRLLVGLTQEAFANLTGMSMNRLINIEKKNARMFAEDVIQISQQFPMFLEWMILDGDISLKALRAGKTPYLQLAYAKVKLKEYPEIFEGKFK